MAECSTTSEYDIEEEMMERLTDKYEADAQRKEYERRLANGYPRNIPEERFLRLAAYEDTRLTPAEVLSMHGEWRAMMSVLNSIGGGYTRLRELAEADKDGRVVVLPCKVGGAMLDTSYPDKPRLMERVHFAVAYVSSGIVFHQPYNIFLENIAAGYIKPVSEEATQNE